MNKLDLNKLPKIPTSVGILHFNPLREFPKLNSYTNAAERIHGCSTFIGLCSSGKKADLLTKAAYFRACLNEFVSISEMLKFELPELSIEKQDIPLFHFFKELRASNFHIKSLKTKEDIMKFSIVSRIDNKIDENSIEIDLDIFTIKDCNVNLFSSNNNYNRFYNTPEFSETINWVNTNQMSYGIWLIVELALKQYCEKINNSA